jgi:ABC-type transport system involved in cytochrome c biogenesis ATPase subunit
MPLPVALSLVDVTVRYGDRVALDRVSLEVRRGEIVGLLGPNGSGKSSALAVAAGVLDPAAGSVAIEGRTRAADPAAYALRVGLVPQEPAVYDELTAYDNLAFFGELYGLSGSDLRRRVLRSLSRVKLSERAPDRASTFSGGLKQRLKKLGLAPAPVKEQEPDRVGRIIIEVNTKTSEKKILEKLSFRPGQVLQYPALEEARAKLQKAGFRDVTVEVVPNELDSVFKDIRVRVIDSDR